LEFEDLAGEFIDVDTLIERLKSEGYEATYTSINNRLGNYFAIVRAERKGKPIYLGVESFTGDPICVGIVQVPEPIQTFLRAKLKMNILEKEGAPLKRKEYYE